MIVLCTVLSITVVGFISVGTSVGIIEETSASNLELIAANSALELDTSIDSIAQSVNTLSEFALYSLTDMNMLLNNSAYSNEYVNRIESLARTLAENTKSCTAVYMAFNPELEMNNSIFLVHNSKTGEYEETTPTDITAYDKSDTEHVGWYYQTLENGGPTWLEPYMNKNINVYMVSYVIPIYKDGVTVGVVGMDIDFNFFFDAVNSITVYDTGYAFLTNDRYQAIVFKDLPVYSDIQEAVGYDVESYSTDSDGMLLNAKYDSYGVTWSCTSERLKNGMFLFLTAQTAEIYAKSSALTTEIIIIAVVSFVVVAITAGLVLNNVMRLASIDELTGLPNRKLFIQKYKEVQNLEKYAMFLFDIDYFKSINDKLGHNMGDAAIKDLAKTAVRTLGKETLIARWGGDEFIGLIPADIAETALERLRWHLYSDGNKEYGKMTISIGAVRINPKYSMNQMTELVDKALYQSKVAGRNHLTIIKDTQNNK